MTIIERGQEKSLCEIVMNNYDCWNSLTDSTQIINTYDIINKSW